MGYQIDFPSFTGQSRRLFYALLFVFLILTEPSMQCGPGRQRINSRRHRKLTPLVFKQHIPNVSENTLGASGLAEGRITRDDPAFKDLVANHNPDIIFKDEERTGSDRIMSERCKDKLNTLAIAVMSRWAGVKLRVTEAWDEDGHHAWDSLHYEGRAVDITPSDRDRTKYGMLARLAVEAGFDWVYYESRSHIHCSVKSDSSIAIKTGGCFPGVGTAYLFGGYTIPMNQLSVGDMVLAMDANGQPVFSKILLFAHVERHRRMAYTLLETSDGRNVSLTPGHLIHASRTEHVRPEQSTPIFAADVKVGDFIYTTDSDTVPQSSLVTKVTAVVYKGAYAPITQHGTIVVDDVVTSCYAMINSHTLAHWSLAPVRMYDTMMNYAETALSARDTRCQSCSAENIEGVHWYINLLHDISLMVIESGSFYHR